MYLNATLTFPTGRCTAFIGPRGGHKSHLGYLNVLGRLRDDQAALVISLRDDEAMTRHTLDTIITQEFGEGDASGFFDACKDRFEILYYHPGYITPEEFFHRMFVSIQCLKSRNPGRKLTVLFNSLDQLSARFPLCAKQEIFVPGIIETLTGEGITGIFIAVDEPGQPVEQYGLLPMADLIISFQPYEFNYDDYYGHVTDLRAPELQVNSEYGDQVRREHERLGKTKKEVIVLQVVRHAGGHAAGDRGILELVGKHDDCTRTLYSRQGLHYTPLSPKYLSGHAVLNLAAQRERTGLSS